MRRLRSRITAVRLGILCSVGLTCLVVHLAGLRTRFGVFAFAGAYFYVLPLDGARIDDLTTKDPGPYVAFPGFEYIKLYRTYPYPWHVRLSPFWTVFFPTLLLALLLPRFGSSRAAGFTPIVATGKAEPPQTLGPAQP